MSGAPVESAARRVRRWRRPPLRPRFRTDVARSEQALRTALERGLARADGAIEGDLTRRHATLRLPADARRPWTPDLDLSWEPIASGSDTAEAAVRIWGTFSPRAEIWTALVFSIGTLAGVGVFATMIGLAQLGLGWTPSALLALPVVLVASLALQLAALIGQGLSVAEMYRLRAFFDDCLRDTTAAEARAEPLREDGDRA